MGATVVDRAIIILSDLGHPEHAAFAGAAVTTGPFTNLSVLPLREIPERVQTLTRLRTDLGDEHYTAIVASAEAMSRHDLAERFLSDLDYIIADAAGS